MHRSRPFALAHAMFAAIAALSAGRASLEQFALAHTPYRSRGKGRAGHSGKKWGGVGTNWLFALGGQTNGERERNRRLGQIARGIIQVG